MNGINTKYPIKGNIISILQRFAPDENTVNVDVLTELDPIIKSMQNIINAVVKMNVPQSLTSAHLDFLNGLERTLENLNDIKLYDNDPIVFLGAVTQYGPNITLLGSAIQNLKNEIAQKLNN
jgi:hypothetical protein